MARPVFVPPVCSPVDSLELLLPLLPAALHLQSYEAAEPVEAPAAYLHAVGDPQHNIFLDLFRRGILADIARERPDIVGISIHQCPQMLAGMTLGYLDQTTGLPCHVTVGGPHISMLRGGLPKTCGDL